LLSAGVRLTPLAHLYRNVELPKRDKPGDYVAG
jgi:hypothetical protein